MLQFYMSEENQKLEVKFHSHDAHNDHKILPMDTHMYAMITLLEVIELQQERLSDAEKEKNQASIIVAQAFREVLDILMGKESAIPKKFIHQVH
jgi:hypothetical protein